MSLEVVIKNEDLLTIDDKRDLEKQIDILINSHKNNTAKINQYMFESVTALSVSESRVNELESQGFFKRMFGVVTGKNKDIQANINKDLARAQYSSQMMMQKLAEQNLMSFEMITAVNNKLNTLSLEMDQEINNIYATLTKFFKMYRADILSLESRVDILERNVKLLTWSQSIEYQMKDEIDYIDLSLLDKIFWVAVDFFELTKGKWNIKDLMVLKSTLLALGISRDDKIRYIDIVSEIANDEEKYERMIGIPVEFMENFKIDLSYMPLLNGIVKLKKLNSDEKYIVDLLKESLNKSSGIIKVNLLNKYVEKSSFEDLNSEVKIYDVLVEILFYIKNIKEIFKEKIETFSLKEVDLERIKELSNYGDINALSELGRRYTYGILGAKKNETLGFEIQEKAKKLGLSLAEHRLGRCYEKGLGTSINERKALELYIKASKKNEKFALNRLGEVYKYGLLGVETSYEKAFEYIKRSSDLGYSDATSNLFWFYVNGNYVQKDNNEAYRLANLAIEQDEKNGYAWSALAYCYTNSIGVQLNYVNGLELNLKAADLGSSIGMDNAGWAYCYGNGTPINRDLAIKYWKMSGSDYAKDKLRQIYNIEI